MTVALVERDENMPNTNSAPRGPRNRFESFLTNRDQINALRDVIKQNRADDNHDSHRCCQQARHPQLLFRAWLDPT